MDATSGSRSRQTASFGTGSVASTSSATRSAATKRSSTPAAETAESHDSFAKRVREVIAIDVERSPSWQDEPGLTFTRRQTPKSFPSPTPPSTSCTRRTRCTTWSAGTALAEYRRVLKPGGSALIVEANRYNPIFYPHMTLALGHEHFTRRRFRALVSLGVSRPRASARSRPTTCRAWIGVPRLQHSSRKGSSASRPPARCSRTTSPWPSDDQRRSRSSPTASPTARHRRCATTSSTRRDVRVVTIFHPLTPETGNTTRDQRCTPRARQMSERSVRLPLQAPAVVRARSLRAVATAARRCVVRVQPARLRSRSRLRGAQHRARQSCSGRSTSFPTGSDEGRCRHGSTTAWTVCAASAPTHESSSRRQRVPRRNARHAFRATPRGAHRADGRLDRPRPDDAARRLCAAPRRFPRPSRRATGRRHAARGALRLPGDVAADVIGTGPLEAELRDQAKRAGLDVTGSTATSPTIATVERILSRSSRRGRAVRRDRRDLHALCGPGQAEGLSRRGSADRPDRCAAERRASSQAEAGAEMVGGRSRPRSRTRSRGARLARAVAGATRRPLLPTRGASTGTCCSGTARTSSTLSPSAKPTR